MKIAIDAGHGANTPGKRTPPFPDGHIMHEHEFNYATANYVVGLLSNYEGVQVHKTYEEVRDVPLKERTDEANAWGADVFVSIHANAVGTGWNSAHGVETFVYTTRPSEAIDLAKKVQSELVKSTDLYDRGVKDANFHVLRETHMTAILVECGFMTNRHEAELLEVASYRHKCAAAIASGIVDQYNLKKIKEKKEDQKVSDGPFTDVPGDRWSAKAIERLKEKGIFHGRPDGTFGPTDPATREELATAIDNVLKFLGK